MNELVFKSDVINLIHKYFGDEINKLPWKKDGDDLYLSGKLVAPLLNHNAALSNAIKELPPVDAIEIGIDFNTEDYKLYFTLDYVDGDGSSASKKCRIERLR